MQGIGRVHIGLEHLLQTRLWLHASGMHKRHRSGGLLAGRQLSRRHGQSSEFDQVRDYQQGDDARHIDWRASARAGGIQSRLFRQELDRPLFILVEQSPAMFFASSGHFKSVQAAMAASLLGWAGEAEQRCIGGCVFGSAHDRFIPAGRHRQALLQLLQAITDANNALSSPFSSEPSNPLLQALNDCRSQLSPDSLLVVICSQSHLDDACSGVLSALAARHESIWLPVYDPLEHALPAQVAGLAGAHNRQLWLSRSQQALQQQWQQQALQLEQRWQLLARQQQARLLPLCTTDNLAWRLAGFKGAGDVA